MTKFERSQREWYRERLADATLLDGAVAIRAERRFIDLAVPVGGTRRGGYVSCCSIRRAKAAYFQLEGRPGFPSVRIDYSPYRDACHCVCWGEQPPEEDDNAIGRFYGYREEVLRDNQQATSDTTRQRLATPTTHTPAPTAQEKTPSTLAST